MPSPVLAGCSNILSEFYKCLCRDWWFVKGLTLIWRDCLLIGPNFQGSLMITTTGFYSWPVNEMLSLAFTYSRKIFFSFNIGWHIPLANMDYLIIGVLFESLLCSKWLLHNIYLNEDYTSYLCYETLTMFFLFPQMLPGLLGFPVISVFSSHIKHMQHLLWCASQIFKIDCKANGNILATSIFQHLSLQRMEFHY